MDLDKLSGLEVLIRMVGGEITPPTMAETMHLKLVKVAEGYAEFLVRAGPRHMNATGMVHAGWPPSDALSTPCCTRAIVMARSI